MGKYVAPRPLDIAAFYMVFVAIDHVVIRHFVTSSRVDFISFGIYFTFGYLRPSLTLVGLYGTPPAFTDLTFL
jgi:hypothetical protein